MRKGRNQNPKTGGAAIIEAHAHISLQLVRELLLENQLCFIAIFLNPLRECRTSAHDRFLSIILATELIILP